MSEVKSFWGRPANVDWVWVTLTLLIAAVALCFYASAAGNDFVMFDDDINIYNNPMLGEMTRARLRWAFADGFYMPRYMPLGWISLMMIFEAGGLAPAAYHWVNIILHAFNAALVLSVVGCGLRMVALTRGMKPERGWILGLATGAACFWALHPLRVEPVSWATGLHYLHATFWALVAVLFAWARLGRHGASRHWCLAGAWLSYLFSVLVYPVTLGLPVALWLFERWMCSRERLSKVSPKADPGLELAPLFGISALALAANIAARHWVPSIFPPAPGLEAFSLGQRGLQAAYSAVYYTVRPLLAGEPTPVYEALFVNNGFGILNWMCAAAVGLLLTGLALWGRKVPGFAAWCFASAAAGVSYYGLLESPFQTSDRYTYFPSVLLAFGLAVLVFVSVKGAGRKLFSALALLWLLWLALAVPKVLPIWMDDRALFTHVGDYLMPNDVAFLYKGRIAVKQVSVGDEEAARMTLAALGRAGAPAGVLEQVEEEMVPLLERARVESRIPARRGRVAPDAQTAHIYAMRAVRAGEAWTARVRFQRALEIDPGFNEARYNFGLWLALHGEPELSWGQYVSLRANLRASLEAGLDRALVETIARAAKVTGSAEVLSVCTERLHVLAATVEDHAL